MKAFTLVEVIVAITIISIGLLSMAVLFPAYLRSETHNNLNIQALKLCNQKIEYLKSLDFNDTLLTKGNHSAETLYVNNSIFFIRTYNVLPDYPYEDMKKVIVDIKWRQNNHIFAKSMKSIIYAGGYY